MTEQIYAMQQSDLEKLKTLPEFKNGPFGLASIQIYLGISYNRARHLIEAGLEQGVLVGGPYQVELVIPVTDSHTKEAANVLRAIANDLESAGADEWESIQDMNRATLANVKTDLLGVGKGI